jgi:hypothetical protein
MSLFFLGEAGKIGKNVEVSVKRSILQCKCIAPTADGANILKYIINILRLYITLQMLNGFQMCEDGFGNQIVN